MYNNKNIDSFKSSIAKIDWNKTFFQTNNVNENYRVFQKILINRLNAHLPKLKLKLQTKPKNNWLTVGIMTCCRNKRLLKIITQKFKNTTVGLL